MFRVFNFFSFFFFLFSITKVAAFGGLDSNNIECSKQYAMVMPSFQTDSILTDTSFKLLRKRSFFLASDSIDKKRLHSYIASAATFNALSYVGMYFLWYKGFPLTTFHLYDDLGEWNQFDKFGHFNSAYAYTRMARGVHKWAGVPDKKAIWWAGFVGFTMQSSIEVFDGFSANWGASLSDLAANGAGSMLYVAQELAWNKQIIKSKTSFNPGKIDDPILYERSQKLYGRNPVERLFKDYNAINIWLSVTTSDIFKNQKKAKWFSIAVGYGTGNLYGGYVNTWNVVDSNGNITRVDYTDVKRYRKFFIAPDIDLEKIKVNKPGWKTLLSILNLAKFPSPALEINTNGEIIFHPIYNVGFQYPIFLKK